MLIEFFLAFSLLTFFEAGILCRVNLRVKVKSSKNGILTLIVSILGDFLQNLKARETQVFYQSLKQLPVWVFTSIFNFELSKHYLLFKLKWKQCLHLVGELLTVVDFHLVTA